MKSDQKENVRVLVKNRAQVRVGAVFQPRVLVKALYFNKVIYKNIFVTTHHVLVQTSLN